MEEAFGTRLKLLIDQVQSLMCNGQDLLQKSNDTTGDPVDLKQVRMTYVKLQSAIERFVKDMHEYFRLVQNPSADDMSTYTSIQIRAEEVVVELDLTFNLKNQETNKKPQPESQQPNVTSKLPKMELARFNGNITKWHEFWDRFESNVDSRNINDVDKLLYLQSVLDGEAKRAIEGLDTTNKNYQIAVSTLKDRYGKQNIVVDAHYTALYNTKAADKTVQDCRRTFNEIERHLRVLGSLGEDINHNYLRVIILRKFPEDLVYELQLKSDPGTSSIQEIRKQIEGIISAKEASNRMSQDLDSPEQLDTLDQNQGKCSLETLHVASERWNKNLTGRFFRSSATKDKRQDQSKVRDRSYDKNNSQYRSNRNFNVNSRKRQMNTENNEVEAKKTKNSCIFCDGEHFNDECTKFKTVRERTQRLQGKCYNCLAKGHRASECRSNRKCYHCGKFGEHNRALCPSKDPAKTENLHVNGSNNVHECITVLQTAVVKVRNENEKGRDQVVRIILDCGSQRSYVTRKTAESLQLSQLETNTLSVFTFGADRPNDIESPLVCLNIKTRTNNNATVYANVVPHITNGIPNIPDKFKGHALKDITPTALVLADDSSMGDQVDILIGNDYYYSFVTGDKLKILDDLYLIDSIFGWVWSGRYAVNKRPREQLSVLTYFQSSIELNSLCTPDLPLQRDDLRKLWDLESIGIVDSPTASRDEEAMSQFNATIRYYDNRYHVKWPWITFPPEIPSNFGLARGRLIGLLKRINHDTIQKYDKILKEQLEQDVIEIIPDQEKTENPTHYLPHHCIAKGEKLRLVYDASAKTNGNKSLNECLYRGPILLKDLTGLLIRFREHRIGLVSDVEKAFLQVGLQDEDRDVTRFLWLKDISQPPSYQNLLHRRFQRVPFGVISSPFLLNAVIRHHLSKNSHKICRQIAQDLYVDNLVTGSDSVEGAIALHRLARSTFGDLSMNLREWNSNSVQVMASIPFQQRSRDHEYTKVLGLNWNLKHDVLTLRFELTQEMEKRCITKRNLLSLIASVFDPCGYVVPLMLHARLFLQALWHEKLDWDTRFTKEQTERCKLALDDLKMIKETQCPRCVKIDSSDKSTSYELHAFTDASIQAYAAVVYLRVSSDTITTVHFILGKGRLASKEQQTELHIPKLELLGALIGARLLTYVTKNTTLQISHQYLWTDSQIVTSWCSSQKPLTPFVARRVQEIRQIADLQIRYVPTQINPADVATRPNAALDNINCWLQGPDFLYQEPNEWPSRSVTPTSALTAPSDSPGGQGPTETEVERRDNQSEKQLTEMEDETHQTTPKEATEKEIVSVEKTNESEDTYEDESKLEDKLRLIQNECFKEEVNGVKTDLARSLGVYKDESGLLRCGGRLCNTDWSYAQKHPILIPRDHEITYKIIKTTHQTNYHVGVPHTLSLIRKKFWIPKGRSQVQKVLRRCLPCRKDSGGPFKLPPMAQLPVERVTYSPPYTYTGLDYFGPILVRNNGSLEKRWVCLYTCLAVRSIHMEVVRDMTAEECLLALRRFTADKNVPKMIVSDNATQFKLTAEVLTSNYCIVNQIKWKFIPELSPWFGGFYERLIGLVKRCLKRTIDKHLMNDGQLNTVIKEIAAVVNTRPLTAISGEPDHVLTPADFPCTGGVTLPQQSEEKFLESATTTKTDLIESWKRGQQILKEFIEMFSNQYLVSLRDRKIQHKQPRVTVESTPRVGQLVQVKGSSSNRLLWKVGRIASVIAGKDGKIRVAKVNMGTNDTLTRSIAHLYPLEIPEDEDDLQGTPTSKLVTETHAEDTQVTNVEPNRTGPISTQNPDQLSIRMDDPAPLNESPKLGPVPTTSEERAKSTRRSAQKARERVREWTAHLLNSLHQ